MSLKRKRTSQGKHAAAPDPLPPPEPPESSSPSPWTLPFPRLPTVDGSPHSEDTELKSIPDSGVLSTALLQSRELWIQGYHFPKVWKPTRRGRKDASSNSQYITTRIGICPVVIGPHIFPDARFLWVRKVDEEAEKAEKAAKAAEKAKKAAKTAHPKPPPRPPALPPVTPPSTATTANALTVKALTDIAATSPEFSAILQAVAKGTATPEQHAALTQYMRAASLIGPGRTTTSSTASPARPLGTPTPLQPATKPVTPITTIPKPPITPTSTAPTIPAKPPLSNSQSAPIPPVPNISPWPLNLTVAPQRPVSTPVTRIPPPTGNLTPISPLPNINRAPTITPITRIPLPSTPVQPPGSATTPASSTPASSNPPVAVNPPVTQPVHPATPVTSIPKPIAPAAPAPPTASLQPSTPIPSTTPSQMSPPTTGASEPPLSTTPPVDPMSFVEIAFELAEPGERLLIPRHTILEKFTSRQGGINVLASFIITISNNTVWIPITLKLNNCSPKIYESLAKYVFPPAIVAAEMERIMEEGRRFEASVLRLQIPVEDEGFIWNGLDKKPEKKKYVRKKKEKEKEIKVEENDEGDGKVGEVQEGEKHSLVVGLKYTPGKKENENEEAEEAKTEIEVLPAS